jgi:hypothetical protein
MHCFIYPANTSAIDPFCLQWCLQLMLTSHYSIFNTNANQPEMQAEDEFLWRHNCFFNSVKHQLLKIIDSSFILKIMIQVIMLDCKTGPQKLLCKSHIVGSMLQVPMRFVCVFEKNDCEVQTFDTKYISAISQGNLCTIPYYEHIGNNVHKNFFKTSSNYFIIV